MCVCMLGNVCYVGMLRMLSTLCKYVMYVYDVCVYVRIYVMYACMYVMYVMYVMYACALCVCMLCMYAMYELYVVYVCS